jgi:hypothetical protein
LNYSCAKISLCRISLIVVFVSIIVNSKMDGRPNITVPKFNFDVSCINCNFLNSSNITTLQHKLKMYGVTKLRTDVIFLSDIRLYSSNKYTTECIKNTFLCNPYANYKKIVGV